MNNISCEICMDLIPLVNDGVASTDSTDAVLEHIRSCENCRKMYNVNSQAHTNADVTINKILKKTRLFICALMMFCIFMGFGLTAGDGMFYNSIIMPVIGSLGYIIFGWKAIYEVPVILLVTSYALNAMHMVRGAEHLDIYSLLIWTGIYTVFVIIGIVITWLLHFAFRKD